MNIWLFILIIIFLLIFRGVIRKKLKSYTTKPDCRTYNQFATLSDMVHDQILPKFGITSKLIRTNYYRVADKMMVGDPNKIFGLNELYEHYVSTVNRDFEHYHLFELFFDELRNQRTDIRGTLPDLLVSIKFGA